jgi:hypothetical protein
MVGKGRTKSKIVVAHHAVAYSYVPIRGYEMSSRDSLPLLKQWMRRCYNTHRQCNAPIERYIPTRLVFVGGNNARLCLAGQLESQLKYATLSHCCE